jgi:hypothetical protein
VKLHQIPIKRLLLCAVAGLLAWWFLRDTDPYLASFGLTGNNTLYDYHTARVKTAVYWTMNMCNDGKCLTERDWACGYENGQYEAVYMCFEEIASSAPVWWRLDRIRKECGHRHMVYMGTYGNPKRCQELGGPRPPSASNR